MSNDKMRFMLALNLFILITVIPSLFLDTWQMRLYLLTMLALMAVYGIWKAVNL